MYTKISIHCLKVKYNWVFRLDFLLFFQNGFSL